MTDEHFHKLLQAARISQGLSPDGTRYTPELVECFGGPCDGCKVVTFEHISQWVFGNGAVYVRRGGRLIFERWV
jgi:hypothetical protein